MRRCAQLLLLVAARSAALAAAQRRYNDMRAAREMAKPYLLRNLEIGDVVLTVSPVTITIFVVAVFVLLRTLLRQSTAEASHILLDDQSEEAQKRLEKIKADVGNDPAKFAAMARKYSKCPSGKGAGGSLGRFGRGSMVPPFDRVVFDPETKVGEVQGPIRTNFGWHLILVTEREL